MLSRIGSNLYTILSRPIDFDDGRKEKKEKQKQKRKKEKERKIQQKQEKKKRNVAQTTGYMYSKLESNADLVSYIDPIRSDHPEMFKLEKIFPDRLSI